MLTEKADDATNSVTNSFLGRSHMRLGNNIRGKEILAVLTLLAAIVFCWSEVERWRPAPVSWPSTGSARLVSIERLPDVGDTCTSMPVSAIATLSAEFEDSKVYAATTVDITRPPVRTIRDTYPIYSSVAVDTIRDEVILQDTNLFAIRVFNRLDNTPPSAESTTPKRVVQGSDTKNEYNNGLYVDPKSGEIYNVAMDTADSIFVFPANAKDNAEPSRILRIPHRGFQLAIDEEKQELYSTNQYPPRVLVFRKNAAGSEKPLRIIEGPHTGLADVHGVAVDTQRKLVFVGNWGNASDYKVAGSGKHYPPSITVYSLDANGDAAPLRTIQGPKTQLNWMGAMSLDPATGNLWVANDVGGSVLMFRGTDSGDVAPTQIIKGNKTALNHPAGITVDTKNKEVWVSNMGNSSATVYPLTANGDAEPIRIIRSAPLGRTSVKFGKPQAAAYDSKRDELLVPNCVNTPQIAVFSRLAKENTTPVRVLEGQKTLISRTMHALEYDAIHDEVVVGSPLTQTILTFRGGAGGEEPPIRFIQGPSTQIQSTDYDGNDKIGLDSVNGEIYLPSATSGGPGKGVILVFDRLANGNAAPKRILGGPNTGFTFPTAKGQGFPNVAIDPVRNLLIVASGGSMLIFDRTASGDAKPLRKITGGGGQVKVYPPKGLLIGSCSGGSICAWNLDETEDMTPRYRIPAQQLTTVAFSGLAIDPIHKEIILPSGGRNVIMTFSWPEVFD